jgi:YidC/Oxa1 family membrane protein insertase
VTRFQQTLVRLSPILLLVALALIVAACAPLGGTASGGSPGVTPTPSQAPLEPATPGANPISLLAWLFTPIFQTLFIGLVFLDQVSKVIWSEGNIVFAIIMLTIALRLVVIPLYRRQLVSSRQMQLLQPEIKELQRKYKGDRVKSQSAVSEFYKQRGVNPAGGCLPILLTMGLLIPMYSVFSQGLTNYDPSAMWHVFGINLFPNIECAAAPVFNAAGHVTNPCLNSIAFGINWGIPEPATTGLIIAGFGLSILAVISSLSQLVASRMTLPPRQAPAADGLLPAPHLDPVGQLAAGRPVPVLDHRNPDPDHPAVPDPGLGRDVPAVRLVPGVRAQPQAALPGPDPGPQARQAPRTRPSLGRPAALDRRPRPFRAVDHQAQSNPYRATRETTLT